MMDVLSPSMLHDLQVMFFHPIDTRGANLTVHLHARLQWTKHVWEALPEEKLFDSISYKILTWKLETVLEKKNDYEC